MNSEYQTPHPDPQTCALDFFHDCTFTTEGLKCFDSMVYINQQRFKYLYADIPYPLLLL